MLRNRSLVFRYWITTVVIFLVLAAVGTGVYVWINVAQNIERAEAEIAIKERTVEVLESTVTKLSLATGTFGFSPQDYEYMRELGVERIVMFDRFGVPYLEVNALAEEMVSGERLVTIIEDARSGRTPDAAARPPGLAGIEPVGPDFVSRVVTGGKASVPVRFVGKDAQDAGLAIPSAISVLSVLRGGRFGEEVWLPSSSGPAAERYYIDHPDLTGAARQQVLSAVAGLAVLFVVTSAGSWLLLRRVVYWPLHRYSVYALQIAAGQPVRMPVNSNDDMGDLARAVNGMADALESRATIDALTGLYNLRHLSGHLDKLIESALLAGHELAVVVADLDRFKPINDTYGHMAGDLVLQAVGAAMRKWAGETNVCWRLGGDEFAFALPGKTYFEAVREASVLEQVISSLRVRVSDGEVSPAISLGVASLGDDGDTGGALTGVADRRMYEAKARKQAARPSVADAAA